MSGEQGAATALADAVMAALAGVDGLSQIADGAPVTAADAAAVLEMGPETDWGWKGGTGAELRFAVIVRCGGEAPGRARALGERVRAAVAEVAVDQAGVDEPGVDGVAGWRLVTLVLVRAALVRGAGPGWTAVAEWRARMALARPG